MAVPPRQAGLTASTFVVCKTDEFYILYSYFPYIYSQQNIAPFGVLCFLSNQCIEITTTAKAPANHPAVINDTYHIAKKSR